MNIKKSLLFAALATASSFAIGDKDYHGAEVFTNETFQYGKFEARMMMAAASGSVSSMFLYYNDSYLETEPWVEVDIEILGKDPNSWQSNIITGHAPEPTKIYSEAHHPISPAVDKSYHTYGLEWTPDYVRWTIDGVEIRKTVSGQNDPKDQVHNLIKEQDLRFNLWSHEDAGWVGPWDDSKLPIRQYINWVKVYKYTPGQGENGSDFTLDWTDDFDKDSGRWGYGNWSFDGNRVELVPNNAVIVDGAMVLTLSKAWNGDFFGPVPKDPADNQGGDTPTNPGITDPITPNPGDDQSISKKHIQGVKAIPAKGAVDAKGARISKTSGANYQIKFLK